MDHAQALLPQATLTSNLLREIDLSGPVLAGFPLRQLLEGFDCWVGHEVGGPYKIIDACLTSWIASLDVTMAVSNFENDDAMARVLSRQGLARDALARLKLALGSAHTPGSDRDQLE